MPIILIRNVKKVFGVIVVLFYLFILVLFFCCQFNLRTVVHGLPLTSVLANFSFDNIAFFVKELKPLIKLFFINFFKRTKKLRSSYYLLKLNFD